MNAQQDTPAPSAELRVEGNGHHAYEGDTYYGIPPVKHSIYRGIIAVSYFSIGLGSSAQVLATIIDLADVQDKTPLVRAGRYAALAGSLITPALFIAELGTPRKWYTMLRIYRPTSLMSVGGVWLLTGFGMASGAAALGQALDDAGYEKFWRAFSRVFAVPAALAGSFLSQYMGTELEETSTPLWAEMSPLLSPLFALTNASSAFALFELAGEAAHVSEDAVKPLRILTLLTEAAAVAQLRRVEVRWTRSARISAHYRSRYDLLYRTGLVTLAKAVGLIIRAVELFGGERRRALRPYATAATLLSGAALPFILLDQGNRSADRASDYFEYTSAVPVRGVPLQAAERGAREVRRAGPPRSLSALKWLAIGGLALGTFALLMKPKKAY